MSGQVQADYAGWLKSEALYEPVVNVDAAKWGATAVSSVITPLTLRADAAAEGARQSDRRRRPVVRDRHIVTGARRDLQGRTIRVVGRSLDYPVGILAYVVRAEERDDGTTILSVVRRI